MSKARRVAEKIRRKVRNEHELLELSTVHFLWHHEPDSQGRWLEECFVVLPHTTDNREVQALELEELNCSGGADSGGWPTAPDCNPVWYFGRILEMSWLSEAERIEAIAEFAKVRELDWAREVLRGIAYQLQAFGEGGDFPSYWSKIANIEDVETFRDAVLEKVA